MTAHSLSAGICVAVVTRVRIPARRRRRPVGGDHLGGAAVAGPSRRALPACNGCPVWSCSPGFRVAPAARRWRARPIRRSPSASRASRVGPRSRSRTGARARRKATSRSTAGSPTRAPRSTCSRRGPTSAASGSSGFRLGGTIAIVTAAGDDRVRGLATFAAPASLRGVGAGSRRGSSSTRAAVACCAREGYPADPVAWTRAIANLDPLEAAQRIVARGRGSSCTAPTTTSSRSTTRAGSRRTAAKAPTCGSCRTAATASATTPAPSPCCSAGSTADCRSGAIRSLLRPKAHVRFELELSGLVRSLASLTFASLTPAPLGARLACDRASARAAVSMSVRVSSRVWRRLPAGRGDELRRIADEEGHVGGARRARDRRAARAGASACASSRSATSRTATPTPLHTL